MDVRSKQPIKEHLQKEDVQERILQNIQKGRDEATVTISRAADLFGITENKLRDWEEYGFLSPLRPGGPKGRRLYTPSELDKLAIIRELINAGYSPSDIPADIDKIWNTTRLPRDLPHQSDRQDPLFAQHDMPINLRITQAHAELFWRTFVAQTLRLALLLICEDHPNTTAGLVLPLESTITGSELSHAPTLSIDDLPTLGESLVGWMNQNRSTHTLLTPRPSFQYSSDYRIEPLRSMKAGILQSDVSSEDKTLIVLPREARPLTLSPLLTETLHRLLKPLYTDLYLTRACFGVGMRDQMNGAIDLSSNNNYEDIVLTGLTEMIVRLGGTDEAGIPRWRFSCIFLPNYPASILSQQQRSLIVRAQSQHAPYTTGITTQTPQEPFISSSIKALQSGQIIYQPIIQRKEQSLEQGVLSSVAVPVEGHDGTAIAVIYVASEKAEIFSETDFCVLRILGKMVRELIESYQARIQSSQQLRSMISHPKIVDTQFQEFLTEDELIMQIESLLKQVQTLEGPPTTEALSFIAIDIDNQSNIANKYGDGMARDLSRAVGMRIHSQLRAFKDASEYKLYHICADRFYILLKNMTLEQARSKAELLKQKLEGAYAIDPHRAPIGQLTLTEHLVTIPNITVRLGISSYPYQKLTEILLRYPASSAITEVRQQITGFLEEELALGKQKGGSVVLSWDPTIPGFIQLPL
ncbi:MerR family transcriptional regulator [Tengunoibacter tsumagoiensis]|uniref:HTH merR-type domain-containing protein n=1 Tax=Tengunoibacter tsumagoiensis TaxID=2014871 RepID=A0A401ZTA8_9CHLR|nr:MerR family transcriptional regulator [Tengunoibacter tsumagoiensis]GCE10148.1 hypothetical protein KTT_00070 [Tengunoibacter tsumagoiensis]